MRNLLISLFITAITILPTSAFAAAITLENTYNLDNRLSHTGYNFHPQGLGYDTGSNELLFMQQASKTIYRTDLTGNINGSLNINYNHTTSIAGDGTNYYVGDYTGNTHSADMYSINKESGVSTQLSSEIAAYGGYPIDVRNGNLYRTEISTSYEWGTLSQIRISSLTEPDTITQTIDLDTTSGIGDIAVDSVRNNIWILDFSADASIRRYDLTTGSELDVFSLGLDGLNAGLTFANDNLYYYDWSVSGSTLEVYSFTDDTQQTAPVPEPATIFLLGSGLAGLAFYRRKKK